MNVEDVKQPVFIYRSPDPITEDLISQDYITAEFYGYSQEGYMTSIAFGLSGFTEALDAYNKQCSGNNSL